MPNAWPTSRSLGPGEHFICNPSTHQTNDHHQPTHGPAGKPRLGPDRGNDSITQPLPLGPWWCFDSEQQIITLHLPSQINITVGYDTSSGLLLDVTAWSDLFTSTDNPADPVELLSLAVWPADAGIDWLIPTAEQQIALGSSSGSSECSDI